MNQRDYTYTDSWSKLVEINKRFMSEKDNTGDFITT